MLRPSLAACLASASVALGCAPAPKLQAPTRPRAPAQSAACRQGVLLRHQAGLYRDAGRVLRARLYEERAHALCGSLPAPAPDGDPQLALQRLQAVWSWMAHTQPLQALSPDRLSDPNMAASLEQAVLGLSRGNEARLVVEPFLAADDSAVTPIGGWLRTSRGGLGRIGEWFERYALPVSSSALASEPLGPFADRIALYVRTAPDENDVCVLFDLVDGKAVAAVALADRLSPLALDDRHFALPVLDTGTACAGREQLAEACPASTRSVEIWEAWPPRRLLRVGVPARAELKRGRPIVTLQLPNQGSGLAKARVDEHLNGGYTPTRLAPESVHASDEDTGAELPQLQALRDLGHGLVVAQWPGRFSLIDWNSPAVLGVLPNVAGASLDDIVASPSGRLVAYGATYEAVGLFDRKTGDNRVLLAPGIRFSRPPSFSPDERWLATDGAWGFGYLWDVASGRLVRTLPSPVPFMRVVEDEGRVAPDGFIRSGKEVVLGGTIDESLHRYEVRSGRELPWPTRSKPCPDDARPSQMALRSDGSVVFWDPHGALAYELGADGVVSAHDCVERFVRVEDVSSDGEAFLRRVDRETEGDGPKTEGTGLVQWVSSRNGEILDEWPADGAESFHIISDGRYAIGDAGEVRSLTEHSEIWPRRGLRHQSSPPTLADRTVAGLAVGEFVVAELCGAGTGSQWAAQSSRPSCACRSAETAATPEQITQRCVVSQLSCAQDHPPHQRGLWWRKTHRTDSCSPRVPMMEPTNTRKRDDSSGAWHFHGARDGRVPV